MQISSATTSATALPQDPALTAAKNAKKSALDQPVVESHEAAEAAPAGALKV